MGNTVPETIPLHVMLPGAAGECYNFLSAAFSLARDWPQEQENVAPRPLAASFATNNPRRDVAKALGLAVQ